MKKTQSVQDDFVYRIICKLSTFLFLDLRQAV